MKIVLKSFLYIVLKVVFIKRKNNNLREFSCRGILDNYYKYRIKQDRLFQSDFDKLIKGISETDTK